jgi:hypothetical protein
MLPSYMTNARYNPTKRTLNLHRLFRGGNTGPLHRASLLAVGTVSQPNAWRKAINLSITGHNPQLTVVESSGFVGATCRVRPKFDGCSLLCHLRQVREVRQPHDR